MAVATASSDLDLPAPESLARGDFDIVIRRLADDLAFGSDTSRLVGSGLEYASSRPYIPGDSVRLLNWRLTARTGRAFVREYEALKRTAAYLFVDTSASMSVRSAARSKLDLAVWIASALGLIAQRRMSPVAVVAGGERRIPMEATLSRTDLWRAIEPLRAHDFGEGTALAARLRETAARAGRASLFVVLSDMHDPDAVAAVTTAAQRHDVAVIHLVDPSEAAPPRAGFFRAREAETGRAFLGTPRTRFADPEATRAALLRTGADYLRLSTGEAFIPPLRHFLGSRGLLSRGRG
ncbi:MAG: DUF58 domain-containing protein [Planctomycetaceae bacterium]|nr:DUF58 domain-containing protein [Planctomycetaceae bacterium]